MFSDADSPRRRTGRAAPYGQSSLRVVLPDTSAEALANRCTPSRPGGSNRLAGARSADNTLTPRLLNRAGATEPSRSPWPRMATPTSTRTPRQRRSRTDTCARYQVRHPLGVPQRDGRASRVIVLAPISVRPRLRGRHRHSPGSRTTRNPCPMKLGNPKLPALPWI